MNVDTLVLVLAIILMLVGVAGTVLPALPGVVLVFLTAAAYGWYEGFHQIKANYLMILAGLTLLSVLVSYASAVWGAKYFGSSKAGTWGAVIGVIAGIFFFPPLYIYWFLFRGSDR
nr:DUF456 family protein [Syntrophomonas palmitatica]